MSDICNGPRDPHGFGIEVPPTTVIPTPVGNLITGHVEWIHGEQGRPCPEYVPTKHELEILARHWFDVYHGLAADFALTGQTGSSETREIIYANERLVAIDGMIGPARMNELSREARERILAGCSPEERALIESESDE